MSFFPAGKANSSPQVTLPDMRATSRRRKNENEKGKKIGKKGRKGTEWTEEGTLSEINFW